MYVVDPKTLEFDCTKMTPEEILELKHFAVAIVRQGYVDINHPDFVAWDKVNSANKLGSVRLLTYSTAFVQKALVSLVTV